MNIRDAKRVLILYDEEKAFIGDSFILINKLYSCASFFNHATIDINARNKNHALIYGALLGNNPYIRQFTDLPWQEIDLFSYDLILCINRDEERLSQLLESSRNTLPAADVQPTAIYSLSAAMLNSLLGPIDPVFPALPEISEYATAFAAGRPSQLYISEEEREWGNQWLRENGVQPHEHVYIILDSTSSRGKLLNMDTYFGVLTHLLDKEGVRVLIFDEQQIGKEAFYTEWLGDKRASRLIFAKKLGLRNDLRILSSFYVKVILGPCTGMMHCASGIYNHFVSIGMPVGSAPLMITYTGEYTNDPAGAYRWWGNSPLVKCLIIRKSGGGAVETVVLNDLPREERTAITGALLCEEYMPEQIIRYLPVHTTELII
jgi:hypothetical protein